MPRRTANVEHGSLRGRDALGTVRRELRAARLDRGLSQAAVADAVGIDRSWVSRTERGEVDDLGLVRTSELLAAVGLDLSVRAYPAGGPVRDTAHAALLGRLRELVHPGLRWATEVPLPIPGDLRAWDALISGRDWRCGVEAETRPRDLQALERRLAAKLRDGEVDWLVLLLLDSRSNRAMVRDYSAQLRARFPLPGKEAVAALRAGRPIGGSSVVLL